MPTRRMFLAGGAAAIAAPGQQMRVSEQKGEKLTVTYGGATLFEYRYSASKPKPYVHPLCLADGTPVTLDGPHDHVHHRGLMVAWSEVNGIDFWGEVNPAPHGSIVHRKFERIADGAAAEIVALNDWVADGKVLLRERRVIRAPAPGKEGAFLEWVTELTAAGEPVMLAAGSHVYNGLGVRVVPSMDGGEVLNSKGTKTIEAANGEAAEWCAYTGGGMGVAFFDHPSNPRHPNAFFVMNRAFGYMSAAPTFRAPFELAPGRGVRFRWGVLAFRGPLDAGVLDSKFKSWSRS